MLLQAAVLIGAALLPMRAAPPVRHIGKQVGDRACAFMSSAVASFEDALEVAPTLCAALEEHEDNFEAHASELAEMLSSSAGARGFFVNWLTADAYKRADVMPPPAPLIAALEAAPREVNEVMLMNVVMSAATKVAAQRVAYESQTASSERTCQRASLLVQALIDRSADLKASLGSLTGAVAAELRPDGGVGGDEEDSWTKFLGRWRYDEEQLLAVEAALADCCDRA